jgi:hypothetical protein
MRISILRAAMAASATLASSAEAEVKSVSATHFEVESKVVAAGTPSQAYEMLGRIGEWWNKDHSYSKNAANLSLALKAGGCFCETLADGGTVEHLRIIFARPGSMLRATGGLGPLQGEAVTGTLTWSLKAVAGGTEITQTYIVSGHLRSGMVEMAPAVDGMLAEQLSGLQKRLAP